MPRLALTVLTLLIGSACYDTMTERREIRSCQNLAWLSKQLGAYRTLHGVYPTGDVQSLVQTFRANSPVFVNDEWGTPFRYEVTADGLHYTLRSAGADKQFEETSSLGEHSVVSRDAGRDIIVRDGLFVQFPQAASRAAKPAAPN